MFPRGDRHDICTGLLLSSECSNDFFVLIIFLSLSIFTSYLLLMSDYCVTAFPTLLILTVSSFCFLAIFSYISLSFCQTPSTNTFCTIDSPSPPVPVPPPPLSPLLLLFLVYQLYCVRIEHIEQFYIHSSSFSSEVYTNKTTNH